MSLTREQVLRIAKLARIELTDKEVELFTPQLSSILDYVNVLQEVDTDGVEETYQVTGLSHVLASDDFNNCDINDELLAQSEYPIKDHQIEVKKVI